MLSICIPHYNFVNPGLFENLYAQCAGAGIEFEILIADDASSPVNKTYLKDFIRPGFQIFLLGKNMGRSAIRNFLAGKASYPHLLFLDADAEIVNGNFIATYLQNLSDAVVSGGRIYDKEPPKQPYLLHWKYGTKIEQNAYMQFHSNNFVIPKAIYNAVKFDENIKDYGYEDVLFGLKAKKNGYFLKNINNPVKHIQLKTNEKFIADTEQALKNLTHIIVTEKILPVEKEVKVVSTYKKLKKYRLTFLLSIQNKAIQKHIKTLLLTLPKAPIFLIAVYKLYYFHALQKN